jgi:monoamine oxidase
MAEGESAESYSADVAVIGAGAAGLAASGRIADAGRSVLLLEARNRVGGRIWTVGDSLELGAELVHGSPEATLALLREAGAGVVELTGERFVMEDGRIQRMNDRMVGELHGLLDRAANAGRDMSVAEFLADVVEEEPGLGAVVAWVGRLVEGFDAADPQRASLQALVAEWTSSATFESTTSRPRGGYATLIEHMARVLDPRRVELSLESIARVVRWSAEGVELDVERHGVLQRHRVRKVVITLPLGVLQAAPGDPGAVRFEPRLDEKKCASLAGLAMGPVHKVLLKFREPFWEKIDGGRWRNAAFFNAAALPFRTFWTQLPARSDWLTAWVGGPGAEALSGGAENDESGHDKSEDNESGDDKSGNNIIAKAVESVSSLFGGRLGVASLLEEARFHDWSRDPRARGAYSYVAVGGGDARRKLAEPVKGTLFFAGEATDDSGEATTVAGAITSGERAAREVIAAW